MMFKINDRLATMDIDTMVIPVIPDWTTVDIRSMHDDGSNSPSLYSRIIESVISLLNEGDNVVIGCDAGISRSNAIALGVLVIYFKMDFYDAWELIKKQVPRCNIDPSHIQKLKKLLKVPKPRLQ